MRLEEMLAAEGLRMVSVVHDEVILEPIMTPQEEERKALALEVRALSVQAVGAIERRLYEHRTTLMKWQEPDGVLVPTENDANERHVIRRRFEAAIRELEWVLGLAKSGGA